MLAQSYGNIISCEEPVNITRACRNHSLQLSDLEFDITVFVSILDILEFNEESQSFTMYIFVMFEWYNRFYSIKNPNGSDTNFYEVPKVDFDSIKRPHLMLLNAFEVKKVSMIGSEEFNSFWMFEADGDTRFEYAEYFQVKMGCDFNFGYYPFDDHWCEIPFFDPSYDIRKTLDQIYQYRVDHMFPPDVKYQIPRNVCTLTNKKIWG